MIATSLLTQRLLDLALQRTVAGFQQSLKRTLDQFELQAWAIVFPPSAEIGGRPVFMAHGVNSAKSPLLTLASKRGLDTVFPAQGADAKTVTAVAREMRPEASSRCRILQSKPERGGEFVFFCYRSGNAPDFTPAEIEVLSQIGNILDRCFLALAEAQEHDFQAGLFRMLANLHPDGLCILDNRFRVLYENRKFKEHMQLWNHGLAGLQNLTLPKQSDLPATWREACEQSFRAFQEVKFPPTTGRMVMTQGTLSGLKKDLDPNSWIRGDVRYLAFQSTLGVRPYLMLTSAYQRRQATAGGLSVAQIAERLSFSRRETELADLILRGASASEIAAKLKIAVPTVKTHIRHILHKSGAKNRLQFVGLCRGHD